MLAEEMDDPHDPRKQAKRPRISGTVPRLYERAYEIIACQIRCGEMPAGTRLSETGVATQFGTSRAPARQALIRLESAGFVSKAESRGYIVCDSKVAIAPKKSSQAEKPFHLASLSSWQRIYDEVESEITARTAFASWRIVESELARYYGVSRTVARDVVGRLQQAGVVRKDDRSRWYAPALTPVYVGELYEMRWVLEPVALMSAAPNVAPAFFETMQANLENAINHTETIDGSDLDELEDEMHVRLLDHCGNTTMMQTIRMHQSLLIAHRFLYRWTYKMYRMEPFLPEHLAVVERLRAGRIDEAATQLEQHLKDSRDRALARVDVIANRFSPEPLPYLDSYTAT